MPTPVRLSRKRGLFAARAVLTLLYRSTHRPKKTMNAVIRPLAIVTGASSGIGLELARQCAEHGFDLLIAADRPMDAALGELRSLGVSAEAVQVDLAIREGVD